MLLPFAARAIFPPPPFSRQVCFILLPFAARPNFSSKKFS
jgi:hypothetical protein